MTNRNSGKRQITRMKTPRGVLKWPRLAEPDYGSPQFPDEDGSYNTRIVFDGQDPAFQKFRKRLMAAHAVAVENGEASFKDLPVAHRKRLKSIDIREPFTEVYDPDTEEPTGEYEMRVRMKASGVTKSGPRKGRKWTRKPVIFDAKGKQMLRVPDIWGGTTAIVAFSFPTGGYFSNGNGMCGLSLQLEAVQIIDLVTAGERSADDYGFGEEDGYEHDDDDAAKPEQEDDEDDDDEFGDETGDEEGDDDDPEGAADF